MKRWPLFTLSVLTWFVLCADQTLAQQPEAKPETSKLTLPSETASATTTPSPSPEPANPSANQPPTLTTPVTSATTSITTSITSAVSTSSAASSTTPQPPQWSGDLRYRLNQMRESIDEPRPYQQLRARLMLKAEVASNIKAQIRFATASSAISTNQTLGDTKDPGFARRSFGLDLAAMSWQPDSVLKISGGRTPNPFWAPNKSQLIYDSDLSFEGFSAQSEWKMAEAKWNFTAGFNMISENWDKTTRSDLPDIGLLSAQFGASHNVGPTTLSWGLAYHEFTNIQDQPITLLDKSASIDEYSIPYDRYRGNTVYTLNPGDEIAKRVYRMMNKFTLQNFGIELKSKWNGYDLSAYFDSATNTGGASENKAFEYGIGIKSGRTSFVFAKAKKEADSVVAAFSDSDMSGGGTDTDGQRLSFLYQLSNQSQMGINLFSGQRGIGSTPRSYSATQVDFMVNF